MSTLNNKTCRERRTDVEVDEDNTVIKRVYSYFGSEADRSLSLNNKSSYTLGLLEKYF
jgi:hypothetical protein